MLSTMQDAPLLVSGILRHGQQVYGDSQVITITGPAGEAVESIVHRGGRTGPSGWPRPWPARGRGQRPGGHLPVEQPDPPGGLSGHPRHGCGPPHLEPPALPRAAGLRDQPRRGQGHHRRRLADPPAGPGPRPAHHGQAHRGGRRGRHQRPWGRRLSYEELVGAEEPGYDWPTFDERQAAAMCYTSGTTGNPKGVVYSHRSTYLHSMAITSASSLGHQRARPGARPSSPCSTPTPGGPPTAAS